MQTNLLTLYVKFQCLATCEEGQDLVEYMLLASLIALSIIAGMGKVATMVTQLFTNVSSSIAAA